MVPPDFGFESRRDLNFSGFETSRSLGSNVQTSSKHSPFQGHLKKNRQRSPKREKIKKRMGEIHFEAIFSNA